MSHQVAYITAQVFTLHHGAVQPHTTIPRLNLFQYILSMCYGPYSSWKFQIFCVLAWTIMNDLNSIKGSLKWKIHLPFY